MNTPFESTTDGPPAYRVKPLDAEPSAEERSSQPDEDQRQDSGKHGQQDAPADNTAARLHRLHLLLDAINRLASRLQRAEDADEIGHAVGEALRSVGIESALCLLDREVDLHDESSVQAMESAVAHGRYFSLAPARLRSLERLLGRRASAIPLPLGRIAGAAASVCHGQPVLLDHIEQHMREALPWLPPGAASHATRLLRAETAIVAPLVSRNHLRGFLAVWAPDLRAEDTPLIGAIAVQAGSAFENVWLASDAERRERRLVALSQIGTEVSGTLRVDEVFERVVARGAEALGVEHIGLWLLDQAETLADGADSPPVVARLVAQRGLSPLHQHLGASLTSTSALFGSSARHASPRGRPTICPDVAQASELQVPLRTRLALLEQGYRSFIAAPVLTPGNEVTGALIAYSTEPHAFKQEDGAYLEAIGRHAAMAIEQGRLFHAVESGRALLSAVFDATPVGIAVLEGTDHRVRMANPQLCALSARPDVDPVGQPIQALFPPDRTSLTHGIAAILDEVGASRHSLAVRGVELHAADGAMEHVVTVNVAPIQLGPAAGAPAEPDALDEGILLSLWDTTAHVRAETRLAAQVQRAETLASVATALERERHLPDLLQRIVRAAQELTGADVAAFVLRDSPHQRFHAAVLLGGDPRHQLALERALVPDLRVLRPLLNDGYTVLCNDASISSTPAEARLFERAHVRALAGAAVSSNERWIMGGLVVAHGSRGQFTTEHTDLLRALAAQAAAAIQRTRALEDARRHADELEAVFGGLAEGVAIYDSSGFLVRLNPAASRMLGVQGRGRDERARALRSPALRRLNGSVLRDDETPGGRAVNGEVFTDAEYLHIPESGRESVVSASGAPLLDASGALRGAVVAFRDVTEVRRLEGRTREALDALLQLAAALVAPFPEQEPALAAPPSQAQSGLTPDPALDALLRHFCRLIIYVLGCDRASINLIDPETHVIAPGVMVGLAPVQAAIWHQEQIEQFGPGVQRVEDRTSLEVQAKLFAGEWAAFEIRAAPHFDPAHPDSKVIVVPLAIERELVGVMMLDELAHATSSAPHEYSQDDLALAQGVARLAALAVQQQRLRRLATEVEALRAANALKEEFLSIASHELKTPLTVLQARTQSTQRRLSRLGYDEAAALFAPVQSSLNRIQALVNELLDASRIEAGKLELHRERRHLGELVREAVSEARERSDQPIELHGAEAPELWVEADPERMMQVLANLLDNATKYSPPEGRVVVWLERRTADGRDEVVMTVSDQGVGIPPDEVEHVFERFYRARTSSVRQYGGLGLGLHIAATIVERHGGRIWAESPGAGAGSTFGLAMPPATDV
jgi:signal transduction histidine kinase/PAS domain-containing protein